MAVINGTDGNDVLVDTAERDTINAGAGDDTVTVTTEFDVTNGGAGDDKLIVDYRNVPGTFRNQGFFADENGGFRGRFFAGDNMFAQSVDFTSFERFEIRSGDGADLITTGTGADAVFSGAGDDMIFLGSGLDSADGGAGVDSVRFDLGAVTTPIFLNLDRNTYSGPAGTSFVDVERLDSVILGSGNDTVTTSRLALDDGVTLGAGSDSFATFNGRDSVNGGEGFDTLVIDYSALAGDFSTVANITRGSGEFAISGFIGNAAQSVGVSFVDIEVVTIATGAGNDNIRFDGVTALGLVATLGAGDDYGSFSARRVDADGGVGVDTLFIDRPDATESFTSGEGADAGTLFGPNGGIYRNFENFGQGARVEGGRQVAQVFSTFGGGDDFLVTSRLNLQDTIVTGRGSDRVVLFNGMDQVVGNAGVGTGDDEAQDTLVLDYSDATATVRNINPLVTDGEGVNGRFIDGATRDVRFSGFDRFEISGGSGQDLLAGAGGNDVLVGNGDSDNLRGEGGDDQLDGGAGDDNLAGGAGDDLLRTGLGNDAIEGEAGVDTLRADFSAAAAGVRTFDQSSGEADRLDAETTGGFAGRYAAGQNTGTFFSGIENFDLTGSAFADRLVTGGGDDSVSGGSGDDFISGRGGDDFLAGGIGGDEIEGGDGNDTLKGGEGADTMRGGDGDDLYDGVDDVADLVVENAGEGRDEIFTSLADYTLPENFEDLFYEGEQDVSLRGNAGDNEIRSGSARSGFFDARDGGNDFIQATEGDDGFYFGAALTSDDRVFAFDGDNDQIGIQGDYANLVLGTRRDGFNSVSGVETLVLLSGSDTRFGDTSGALYSYDITALDGLINDAFGGGDELTVNMNTLRAGENVTFDGSAETTGSFLFFGGAGNDVLTGGAGSDAFFFGTGRFGSGDRVVGGSGADDQLGLQGDYSGLNALTLGADQLAGIETVVLLSATDTRFGASGATGFGYTVATNDGNVAAGAVLTINANTLTADEVFRFDGTAETDGAFRIFGGAARDVIFGGAGDDEISGGGGADLIIGGGSGDRITGGAGDDLFIYGAETDSGGFVPDVITDFTRGDVIDLEAIDADRGSEDIDEAFQFIGEGAFTQVAGELRVVRTDAGFRVEGDTNGDGGADVIIVLNGVDIAPVASDFVL